MSKLLRLTALAVLVTLILASCGPDNREQRTAPSSTGEQVTSAAAAQAADVTYTLETGSGPDGLAFIGVGGDIDGVANPTLLAKPGDTITIQLINADGMRHDLTLEDLGVTTGELKQENAAASVTFTAPENGTYVYFCSIVGHRLAGMEGTLQVSASS